MEQKDKPIIHKVLSPCDCLSICGETACNWNKSAKWTDCTCPDCLRFKRRVKEKIKREVAHSKKVDIIKL